MSEKIKVLVLSIWYPMSISRYFEKALRRNKHIDLLTTGPFTGPWIPWMGGMDLPMKYATSPDIPIPLPFNVERVNYDLIRANLPADWKPDIVLSIDAGINWVSKPFEGFVATVATDPHVLNYDHARKQGKLFNMQLCYSERGDEYLPYAYDPATHFPEPDTEKIYDGVLIGLQYDNRLAWVEELRKHGISVFSTNGPAFDEYRHIMNQSRIGMTWSSMNDTIARFFETPAMGLPMVANRTPDAHIFLREFEEYIPFSNLGEAVDAVIQLKNKPDLARDIAAKGHDAIKHQTYDARVEQILESCGFGYEKES